MTSARPTALAMLLLVTAIAASGLVWACHDPWIHIMSPDAGKGDVSGTLEVKAEVKKDVVWKQVEFFVDGKSIGTDTTAPYSVMWETTKWADGAHKLQAKGTLEDGTVKESPIVEVTIKNG